MNFLHCGFPKTWYIVPTKDGPKLVDLYMKKWLKTPRKCQNWIQHRSTVIDPALLVESGIDVHVAVQQPNELMLIGYSSHHQIVNAGKYLNKYNRQIGNIA